MNIQELINDLEAKTIEELMELTKNPNASYEEVIIASKIITDKQIEEGNCYTMEEVFGEKVSNTINSLC